MNTPRRYCTRKKLAEYLNVHAVTTRRWELDVSLGFPKPSVIHGKPMWDILEIDAWMKSRKAESA